jgi:hypothetical protein
MSEQTILIVMQVNLKASAYVTTGVTNGNEASRTVKLELPDT